MAPVHTITNKKTTEILLALCTFASDIKSDRPISESLSLVPGHRKVNKLPVLTQLFQMGGPDRRGVVIIPAVPGAVVISVRFGKVRRIKNYTHYVSIDLRQHVIGATQRSLARHARTYHQPSGVGQFGQQH